MVRRAPQCLVAGLCTGWLVLTTSPSVPARIVFEDHFDGSSGAVPPGWRLLQGPGAAVESASVVTLEGDVTIGSDMVVDPGRETITITMVIADMATNADQGTSVGIGLVAADSRRAFRCDIHPWDGAIIVLGLDDESGLQPYVVGYLDTPPDRGTRLTLVLASTEFTVLTESPHFSAGPISYRTVFSTWTRDDLGSAATPFIRNHAPPEWWTPRWSSRVDRVTIELGGPRLLQLGVKAGPVAVPQLYRLDLGIQLSGSVTLRVPGTPAGVQVDLVRLQATRKLYGFLGDAPTEQYALDITSVDVRLVLRRWRSPGLNPYIVGGMSTFRVRATWRDRLDPPRHDPPERRARRDGRGMVLGIGLQQGRSPTWLMEALYRPIGIPRDFGPSDTEHFIQVSCGVLL